MILEKVYNRGQNLLINAKKLSKSKQEYKLLISVFAHFLNAIAKFYFWKTYSVLGSNSTHF